MSDVMVDLETLGTRPGSIILSIGSVAFDRAKDPLDWPEFYSVISIASSRKFGLTSDESTSAWWSRQSLEARRVLDEADDPSAPTLPDVLKNFGKFLMRQGDIRACRLWGNGSDFDNVLLVSAFQAAMLGKPPWNYYNHRCYRTLKNLFPQYALSESARNAVQVEQHSGVHHNALDDARFQALSAVRILQKIDGMVEDSEWLRRETAVNDQPPSLTQTDQENF